MDATLTNMENLGYLLFTPPHARSPGFTKLCLAIRPRPTERHFDPESIQLPLCQADGTISLVELGPNPDLDSPTRLGPGRIIAHDRFDKAVEFFSFGAQLQITVAAEGTFYIFSSPAPLLQLNRDLMSLPDQLAAEAEARLGMLRPRWGTDDRGFIAQLASAPPLPLYAALLAAILARFEPSRSLRTSFSSFYHLLQEEREWLTSIAAWPESHFELENLLQAPSVALVKFVSS